jgi:heavy metal translocating P-type ATPase
MNRRTLREYSFLVITLASLTVGLGTQTLGLHLASTGAFAIGAIVGFALATRWLINAIRLGEFGSDVLAVIAIASTAVTNEWLAASVIAVMLATGRALEQWAAGKARNQLEALIRRAPAQAHVITESGEIIDRDLSLVAPGSTLLVRSGEVVPLDGKLITSGTFDESALTGEPLPVWREANTEVRSGVLNSGGSVELTTTCDAEDSTYSGLIRLVQSAQATSAPGVRIANKWAVWFVPFAIGLALATWLVTGDYKNAVAVIVAATPCPLILAVPVAVIAGMSRAAGRGSIIKGGAALEQLARAKTVLLDKTGTLTHGGPSISEIYVAPGASESSVLRLAASLEQASPHVVAMATVAAAKIRGLQLSKATNVVESHGQGLEGIVDGLRVNVGQLTSALPAWASDENSLLVAIEIEGELKGIIGLDDPVREESIETIRQLRALGVDRIAMISGDRASTANQVGEQVGVDQVFAECMPEQKLEIVHREMAASRGSVIAVGDGINDAPALAAATVGVAMGARGATAASEAADVVIVEDSLSHLAITIDLAKGARSRALQAAGVGMGLAMAAMFAAALGLLNSTAAAISQEFIDMAAILWALVPGSTLLRAKR